jgi:RHS repeat-associated protein
VAPIWVRRCCSDRRCSFLRRTESTRSASLSACRLLERGSSNDPEQRGPNARHLYFPKWTHDLQRQWERRVTDDAQGHWRHGSRSNLCRFCPRNDVDQAFLYGVAPPGYRLEIEDMVKNRHQVSIGGTGGFVALVRLLPEQSATPAGTATSLLPGRINWRASLGTLLDGTSAGELLLTSTGQESSPSAAVSLARLSYDPPSSEVEVFMVNGGIRQIVAPSTAVDIVNEPALGRFEVRFYHRLQAVGDTYPRTFTGLPFVSYLVSQDGSNMKLTGTWRDIASFTDTGAAISRQAYSTASSAVVTDWALVGQSHLSEKRGQWNGVDGDHTLTDPAGTVLAAQAKTYTTLPYGGSVVSQSTVGTGAAAMVESFQYYTNPSQASYGKVSRVDRTDGSWSERFYHDFGSSSSFPGLLASYRKPFQDGGANGVVDIAISYSPDPWGMPTRIASEQRTFQGAVIGSTTTSYSEAPGPYRHIVVTATKTERVNSQATLVSQVKYFRENIADRFFRSKPHAILSSDGTVSAFVHQRGTWSSGTFVADGSANGARHAIIRGLVSASAQGGSTLLATFDGYDIDDLFVVAGKSTAAQVFRDRFGRVVRTESRVWSGTTWALVDAVSYTYDICHRLVESQSLRGEIYTATWTGPLRTSEIDPDGTMVAYTYDVSGRVLNATKSGSGETSPMCVSYCYDAADRVLSETYGPTGDGTLSIARTYDTAGRQLSVTKADGSRFTTVYDLANRRSTTTSLGGASTIETRYLDGQVKSITGSGVVPSFFVYTLNADYHRATIWMGAEGSLRWRKTDTDLLGRTIRIESPSFGPAGLGNRVETHHYSGVGSSKVRRIARNDGTPDTLFSYDEFSTVIAEGLDIDGNLQLDAAGKDRIVLSDRRIGQSAGDWWLITRRETFPQEGSASKLLLGQTSVRLTGYSGNLREEQQSIDVEGRTSFSLLSTDRAARRRTVSQHSPEVGTATSVFQDGLLISQTTADGRTFTFGYDALNRLEESRDPRTGVTRTTYLPDSSRVLRRNDPGNRLIVQYGYDPDGRVTTVYNGASQPSFTSYSTRGQVLRQWGPGTSPVEFGYNTYGERITMTTFRATDASALGGAWPSLAGDVTTWTVDEASGLVHQKTDADFKSTEFIYDLAGRLISRKTARNILANHSYTPTGELLKISYSDSTPAVVTAYNRMGQPTGISDATGTRFFDYDPVKPWRLAGERLDPSFFGSRVIRPLYESGDAVGRLSGYELAAAGAVELSQTYGFGAGGRVETIGTSHRESGSLVSRTFQYGYLAQSALIQSLAIQGGHPYTLNRTYASDRDLLTSIDSRWSSTLVTDYDYVYDDAGRRTSRIQAGSAFSDYGAPTFTLFTYNTRSELTAAVDYLGSTVGDTSTPLPGRRHEFNYDTIGNRTSAGRNGVPATEEESTHNSLNQITTRENHSIAFSGTAAANALVKISGRTVLAGRQGAYFFDEAAVPNSNAPWRGTKQVLARPAGTNQVRVEQRTVIIRRGLESLIYDADGNLVQDGLWEYSWDAECRLMSMKTTLVALTAGFPETTLRFVYDYKGRRVRKEVWGESNALLSRTVTVYEQWNMIAEYNQPAIGGALTLHRSFAWGLDLVGSLQASGGVGALLQMRDYTENATYLPSYDGNGNLSTLSNSASGALAAVYEYGPFGEPLAMSGPYAEKNPFRFSTKYTDKETGLVYYGRRYYDPRNGRFAGRDPIEEMGGINLYGYTLNNPVNRWDYLGMYFDYGAYVYGGQFNPFTGYPSPGNGWSGLFGQTSDRWGFSDMSGAGIVINLFSTPPLILSWGLAVQNLTDDKSGPDVEPPVVAPPVGLQVNSGRYREIVEEQLAQLRELVTPTGEISEIAKIIRALEAANVLIEIDSEGLEGGGFFATVPENASNGVGTGGKIYAGSPAGGYIYRLRGPDGLPILSYGIDVLAHELTHAFEALNGDAPRTIGVIEYEAIRVQNQVRAILFPEQPLRTQHGTIDIPDFAKYITWETRYKYWVPPGYGFPHGNPPGED